MVVSLCILQNLKQQKSRREQFSHTPVSASMPPSAMAGNSEFIHLAHIHTHAHTHTCMHVHARLAVVCRKPINVKQQSAHISSIISFSLLKEGSLIIKPICSYLAQCFSRNVLKL